MDFCSDDSLLPLDLIWVPRYFEFKGFRFINMSVTVIGLILHPLLFGLHFYRRVLDPYDAKGNPRSDTVDKRHKMTRNNSKFGNGLTCNEYWYENKKTILNRIVIGTPLITILFSFIASLISLFNTQHWIAEKNANACNSISTLQNICWLIPKLSIYQIILLRLYLAFHGSIYQYNGYLMLGVFVSIYLN